MSEAPADVLSGFAVLLVFAAVLFDLAERETADALAKDLPHPDRKAERKSLRKDLNRIERWRVLPLIVIMALIAVASLPSIIVIMGAGFSVPWEATPSLLVLTWWVLVAAEIWAVRSIRRIRGRMRELGRDETT